MKTLKKYITEMKPRTLTKIDTEAVRSKLAKECTKYHAAGGNHVGNTDHWNEDDKHCIAIEHSQGSHHAMKEFLQSHPMVDKIYNVEYHNGNYDWRSNNYNKPYTVGKFSLKEYK